MSVEKVQEFQRMWQSGGAVSKRGLSRVQSCRGLLSRLGCALLRRFVASACSLSASASASASAPAAFRATTPAFATACLRLMSSQPT